MCKNKSFNLFFLSTDTPAWVFVSTAGHTGPMIEGRRYMLRCEIQNVAPVEFLDVRWFRGETLVGQESFTELNKKPVTVTLQISPSRADSGTEYRCEAEVALKRNRPGIQASLKVSSQTLAITVHSKSIKRLTPFSPQTKCSLSAMF